MLVEMFDKLIKSIKNDDIVKYFPHSTLSKTIKPISLPSTVKTGINTHETNMEIFSDFSISLLRARLFFL